MKIGMKQCLKPQSFWVVTFTFLMITSACTSNSQEKKYTYQAIFKTDTAIFKMATIDTIFYGSYELRYGRSGKDSGELRGVISGDTLKGSYYYHPYYNKNTRKRMPMAFLMRNSKLILGKGAVATYMNIPFFSPDIPIDYENAEFVFDRITP